MILVHKILGGWTTPLQSASQNGNNIFLDSLFAKCYSDTFYHHIIANAENNGNYLEIHTSSGQLIQKIDFNGSARFDLTKLKNGL